MGLSRAPSGLVTVTVTGGDPDGRRLWINAGRFTAATATLEFTAAQWAPQRVDVTGARMTFDAADETVFIAHVATSQVDQNYGNLAGPPVVVTVADRRDRRN